MKTRILSIVGTLALLGCGGLAAVAIVLVPPRLEVTLEEPSGQAARGVDPIAMLRDDVGGLRSDLEGVSRSFEENLEALAQHLSSIAATQDENSSARVQALTDDVRQLTAAVKSQAVALREFRARVADIAAVARSDGPAPVTSPVAAAPEQAANPQAPAGGGASDVATTERSSPQAEAFPLVPAPEVVAAPTTRTPPPKKKGFLSFKVKRHSFEPGTRLEYRLLPQLSRVGFDAKSTLHDFSGVTSNLEGTFALALGAPDAGIRGQVSVAAGTLKTGVEGRDDEMYRLLLVEQHPQMIFRPSSLSEGKYDAATKTLQGTLAGTMKIAGAERTVSMPVKISLDGSRRLSIEGETTLRMSEYGIDPPNKLGMIKVEDEIKVWIALRARSLGTARE